MGQLKAQTTEKPATGKHEAVGKPQTARDARREAILDAARDAFLEEGFAATSMSTIAARVGGSKATLYTYFKSKEELFDAYVRRHCAWQKEKMYALPAEGEDIEAALTRLGRNYLRTVMSDFSLRHFRMITAEAERSPEIGRSFYEAGPASGVKILAGFLSDARDRGQLRFDGPEPVAHQFLALCQNRMIKARLCAAMGEPSEAEIATEVDRAVRVFLAAYGANK
jgi:AcrR family transcriptional regulator